MTTVEGVRSLGIAGFFRERTPSESPSNQDDLSAKVGAFDFALFGGLDGVFQAISALQRHFNVPVAAASNGLSFLCAGLYRTLRGQDLCQGGEALSPVEDQELRNRGTWWEGIAE